MTDGALLALIIDDADALRVLAAWGSFGPQLSAIESDQLNNDIAAVTGLSCARVSASLIRLRAARVLVDGGVTELADKLLQSLVQQRIGGAKKGKR